MSQEAAFCMLEESPHKSDRLAADLRHPQETMAFLNLKH